MFAAFLTSLAVVALAEIGDKTMLLAIILASRLRAPGAIVLGILVATLANHALAALLGSSVAGVLDAPWLRLAVGLGFIAMAAWTLVPDRLEPGEAAAAVRARGGAFVTTLVSFFIVEMGDKTQIATIALGARFHSVPVVAAGTTLGMLLVNIPAVYLGEALIRRVSLRTARIAAALLFLALGLWQVTDWLLGR